MDKIIILIFTGLIFCSFPDKSSVTSYNRKTDDSTRSIWEEFDTLSTFKRTEIINQALQGLWSAYKGVTLINGNIDGMELTIPLIIEFKGDKYRRNSNAAFGKFLLFENLIIKQNNDTGIINKINVKTLTITWKDKSDYTSHVVAVLQER